MVIKHLKYSKAFSITTIKDAVVSAFNTIGFGADIRKDQIVHLNGVKYHLHWS